MPHDQQYNHRFTYMYVYLLSRFGDTHIQSRSYGDERRLTTLFLLNSSRESLYIAYYRSELQAILNFSLRHEIWRRKITIHGSDTRRRQSSSRVRLEGLYMAKRAMLKQLENRTALRRHQLANFYFWSSHHNIQINTLTCQSRLLVTRISHTVPINTTNSSLLFPSSSDFNTHNRSHRLGQSDMG